MVRILIELKDQLFELFLSADEKRIRQFGAAIEPSSIESNIATEREHFLLEEVCGSRINSFNPEVEMERLALHQLYTSGIHPHLSHLVDCLFGIGDVKASN
jgi:hypothetical protein